RAPSAPRPVLPQVDPRHGRGGGAARHRHGPDARARPPDQRRVREAPERPARRQEPRRRRRAEHNRAGHEAAGGRPRRRRHAGPDQRLRRDGLPGPEPVLVHSPRRGRPYDRPGIRTPDRADPRRHGRDAQERGRDGGLPAGAGGPRAPREGRAGPPTHGHVLGDDARRGREDREEVPPPPRGRVRGRPGHEEELPDRPAGPVPVVPGAEGGDATGPPPTDRTPGQGHSVREREEERRGRVAHRRELREAVRGPPRRQEPGRAGGEPRRVPAGRRRPRRHRRGGTWDRHRRRQPGHQLRPPDEVDRQLLPQDRPDGKGGEGGTGHEPDDGRGRGDHGPAEAVPGVDGHARAGQAREEPGAVARTGEHHMKRLAFSPSLGIFV
ncbi:hypothetical protein THAOC_27484, partial [Thalassiosira oceanica]